MCALASFKLPFKYQGNKSSLSNLFSCPVLMPSVGFEEAFPMFQLKSKSILIFSLALVKATVLAEPVCKIMFAACSAQGPAAPGCTRRGRPKSKLSLSPTIPSKSSGLRNPPTPRYSPPPPPPPTSRPPRRHPEFRSGGGFQLTVTPPLSSGRAALVHLSSCSTSVNFACFLFL